MLSLSLSLLPTFPSSRPPVFAPAGMTVPSPTRSEKRKLWDGEGGKGVHRTKRGEFFSTIDLLYSALLNQVLAWSLSEFVFQGSSHEVKAGGKSKGGIQKER